RTGPLRRHLPHSAGAPGQAPWRTGRPLNPTSPAAGTVKPRPEARQKVPGAGKRRLDNPKATTAWTRRALPVSSWEAPALPAEEFAAGGTYPKRTAGKGRHARPQS